MLDINAAVDLIDEFDEVTFAILKHNNACGLASRPTCLLYTSERKLFNGVSVMVGHTFIYMMIRVI